MGKAHYTWKFVRSIESHYRVGATTPAYVVLHCVRDNCSFTSRKYPGGVAVAKNRRNLIERKKHNTSHRRRPS